MLFWHSGRHSSGRPGDIPDRIKRTIYGPDLADLAIGYDDHKRAIEAIQLGADADNNTSNWRVYWVAALGFLTDSYNLFASNVVLPALTFVYWNTPLKGRQNGFNVATLLGSMIGQLVFGFLVDVFGRRALYGVELAIVIISTLGLLQCSVGFRDEASGDSTWSITPWLFCWRVVMGIGIGAEYPLAACIAAEWSPKQSRARMMSAVFLMQPLGQLLAYIVGLIAIAKLSSSKVDIDTFWRIVIGVGTIPTLLALLARPFLPESWRFTFFVMDKPRTALAESSGVYGHNAQLSHASDGSMEMQPLQSTNNSGDSSSNEYHVTAPDVDTNGQVGKNHLTDNHVKAVQPAAPQPAVPYRQATSASQSSELSRWRPGDQFRNWEFFKFIWKKDNRTKLLGTSLCWFFLDVAFYGMGFNSPGTLAKLWTDHHVNFGPDAPWWQTNSVISNITIDGQPPVVNGLAPDGSIPDWTIRPVIESNMLNAIYTTQIAAILGSGVFILTANMLNRRKMLIYTFFAVAAVLAAIAGSFKQLFHDGEEGNRPLQGGHLILIVLWALAMFLFNFGPNTLTFILPAEIFPTRYRCTCYGIAAATGKLGAVVVQGIVWALQNDPNNYVNLQWSMVGFAICMVLGGLIALIPGAIPDVQKGVENLSLEELTDDQVFVQQNRVDSNS